MYAVISALTHAHKFKGFKNKLNLLPIILRRLEIQPKII